MGTATAVDLEAPHAPTIEGRRLPLPVPLYHARIVIDESEDSSQRPVFDPTLATVQGSASV